jgi:hypothetical protein
MIAVCTTCHKMFTTTTEDAYTPGVLCPACYLANLDPEPSLSNTDPFCQKCNGTGWVTVTDSVDYGSTSVSMESEEPCECRYREDTEINPYILTGPELDRTETWRKEGKP